MRKPLIFVSIIALAVLLLNTAFRSSPDNPSLSYGYLPPIESQPKQSELHAAKPFLFDDYIITPLAGFDISAKVLSREPYWFGREADLSPLDLALGWGRMSDPQVLEKVEIRQSSRWYYWSTDKFPIPRREIETHSANMHLIPANEQVEDNLDSIKQGHNIRLKGQLVRVDAEDGWQWVSSLSREDTGARACELFYVTDVLIQ